MSSMSNATRAAAGRDPGTARRAGPGPPMPGAALRLALGLAERSAIGGAGRAGRGPAGGASRPARYRLPSSTTSASTRAPSEQADLGAEPGPEDAVETDALVPDRIGPEVDAGRPRGSTTRATRTRRRRAPSAAQDRPREAAGRRRRVHPPGAPRAVRRAAGRPARRRPRPGPGWIGVGSSDPAARLVVGSVVVAGASGRRRVVRRRRRRPGSSPSASRGIGSPALGRRPALGLGAAPLQLPHELVEQVTHATSLGRAAGTGPGRGRIAAGRGAITGRWSDSTARRKPASTCSASWFGRIVAASAGSQRNAARIASGQRHGRASSSGGTSGVRRIARRPSSSRISPDSDPANDGPSRSSGGSGGGPAAGPTSRKLTTPSSSATQSTASHQSSGPSTGLRHARPGAGGRRRGPPARAGTRDRDAGGVRARARGYRRRPAGWRRAAAAAPSAASGRCRRRRGRGGVGRVDRRRCDAGRPLGAPPRRSASCRLGRRQRREVDPLLARGRRP